MNVYDALSRVLTRTDALNHSATYAYDAVGNLLTAANGQGTLTFTYDALNRERTGRDVWGLTLTNTYDAAGQRTKLEDSLGGVTTSVYDAASRLTSRQFGGTGQTPLRWDYGYSASDQVTGVTRYSDLAGTAKIGSTSYTYDTAARLTNLWHKDGSDEMRQVFRLFG